jgi:hypothetical protein
MSTVSRLGDLSAAKISSVIELALLKVTFYSNPCTGVKTGRGDS